MAPDDFTSEERTTKVTVAEPCQKIIFNNSVKRHLLFGEENSGATDTRGHPPL